VLLVENDRQGKDAMSPCFGRVDRIAHVDDERDVGVAEPANPELDALSPRDSWSKISNAACSCSVGLLATRHWYPGLLIPDAR
jgi:hypothetical protein